MSMSFKPIKRALIACTALGSIALTGQALAGGTAPGQNVDNIASVNYTVGGVAQTVIRSSPTGNSTPGPGAGAVTTFVVDRKVDLHLAEVSGGPTTGVAPGGTNAVTAFFVRNDGNDTQGVIFSAADFAGNVFTHAPNFPMTNIRWFVESSSASASCASPAIPATPGAGFQLGTDTAVNIPTLAPDTCTWVYVVADSPTSPLPTNGQYANVELTATARVPTTLAALAADTGADRPDQVDVVFMDGTTASLSAQDEYQIAGATFTVRKESAVISDGISASNPKAIPGAVMEYKITLSNSGSATADSVQITDSLPTQTSYATGTYNGAASDVDILVGAVHTYCIAESGGLDGNGDGCYRSVAAGVTTLHVQSPAIAPVAAAGQVIVQFRVTIL